MEGTIAANSLLELIESYIRYYASGSSHTARAKRLDLHHFLDFLCELRACSKVDKLTVSDWDHSSTQRFVDQFLSKGEAPATVSRRLATLKHMGRTLAEKLPGFINPAHDVKGPKISLSLPKALSKKELANVRENAVERIHAKASFNRVRNEVLFNLLVDTGLRADEVRLLKFGQLDDDLEWIRNVRTKGRRYRNVYITTEMRPQLARYLELRAQKLKKIYAKLAMNENRALPLFISTYKAVPGKPETFLMGSKSIWRAINELSANIKLHPHLLRHSFAIDLLDSSGDIRLVAQALGHSDVRITMRYTERTEAEIARALEKSRQKT